MMIEVAILPNSSDVNCASTKPSMSIFVKESNLIKLVNQFNRIYALLF